MTAPLRLDPNAGLVRGVRAAVLTLPTVGGAALAHSFVDGCDSLVALSLAAGLCWPAAVAVLGSRRRLPSLIAWVITAQIATHLLLEATCGDVTSGSMSLGAHLRMGVSPVMLLSHGIAVLATSVLLGRADAGLWTADALICAAFRSLDLSVGVLAPPTVRRTTPGVVVVTPRSSWVAAQPSRRGPPALLAS